MMPWAVPEHSKAQVDKAGRILVDGEGDSARLDEALEIINNWRSSHSFPLNTIQVGLRRLARREDKKALIAQRIKRLSSITSKLVRFSTMKLSQMQDIGGCRAVVASVAKAEAIHAAYRNGNLRHRHQFVREDDYIADPKVSGYRGIHLIFRYQSDRTTAFNGHLVEIQLRSKLQHAWATAVETVSTFLDQSLKSSQGSDRWLRFFALMGSALALREKRPLVPETPQSEAELKKELRLITDELNVRARLRGYGEALQTVDKGSVPNAHYFLLALDPGAESYATLAVSEYTRAQLDTATADYLEVERALAGKPGAEAVLVSVDSLDALRRAYPNYFLDTRVFLDSVEIAIS